MSMNSRRPLPIGDDLGEDVGRALGLGDEVARVAARREDQHLVEERLVARGAEERADRGGETCARQPLPFGGAPDGGRDGGRAAAEERAREVTLARQWR
jgi:hypothetical protein